MSSIKLNATTRHTLLNVIPESDPLHDKIQSHGIMDEIDLSMQEIAALRGYVERVDGTDTHWLNGRMRIIETFRESV